jgi:hypothetical protein
LRFAANLLAILGLWSVAAADDAPTSDASSPPEAPSKFRSPEDGWFDVSGFLEEKYGFLPLVVPITEPAVGYGAAGGLAFLSKPLPHSEAGFGRPILTMVGGMGTENGTWGAVAGDMRHWLDDHLQTLAGFIYSSVNLDFHGIGESGELTDHPLHYNLEPKGGMLQGRYRLGDSLFWAGLNYAYAATQVSFDAPAGTPGLPDFERNSNVGGFMPSVTYDSRENIFTPTHGTLRRDQRGALQPGLGRR